MKEKTKVFSLFRNYVPDKKYQNNKEITHVIISNSIKEICLEAFQNCENITVVELGENVTSIMDGAFENCTNLTTVKFGKNVEYIGCGAFKNCKNLTTIEFGDNVKSIDTDAFYNCEKLVNVNSFDKIEKLGERAFQNCINLTSIELGDNLLVIEEDVFVNCKKLKEIKLPKFLKTIKRGAFFECENLTWLNIPNSVYEAQKSAFYKTGVWNNKDNWTDNVFYVGKRLISTSSNLEGECVIKEGIEVIGADAFFGNEKLTSVVIPCSVTAIIDGAFQNCINLERVDAKNGIKNLGKNVFKNCKKLKTVNIPTINNFGISAFSESDIYNDDNYQNGSLYLGGRLLDVKEEASGNYVVKDGTIGILENAFKNCKNITSVTIPNSVKYIDSNVFINCTSLTEITIPKSVDNIGYDAFYGCKNLKKVYYLGSVDDWLKITFKGSVSDCYSNPLYIENVELYINNELLTEVNIVTATQIKENAFRGYGRLKTLNVGDLVDSIYSKAFKGCSNLKMVVLGNAVNYVSYDAFDDCYKLEKVICKNTKNKLKLSSNLDVNIKKIKGSFYYYQK